MESGFEHLGDGQLLGVIDAALDALTADRLRLPSDREQLDLLLGSLKVGARLAAWQARLAARIEEADVAWREHQTSTTTWLAEAGRLTPREARRLVRAGQDQARFTTIGAAAATGAVLPGQAEAITTVLAELPAAFPDQTVVEAQELMVGFAASHNSAELRRLTGHLLEVLAPDAAEALEAEKLERQQRLAMRRRYLEFTGDGEGSVLIRGSLPTAAAEPFIQIIDAYAAADKRALDTIDPQTEIVTPGMRRADALIAMVHQHSQQALAPTHGGDRPRIVVTLAYDKLIKAATDTSLTEAATGGLNGNGGLADQVTTGGLGGTGGLGDNDCPIGTGRLIGSGEPVPASVVRQWLCDADILPIVLGGPSEILDVGRARRLVTPAMRAALEQRDRGCVFPGCHKPPRDCHAHHIIPWWAGGPTALSNLVLLCAHHHGIIEPSRNPNDDRWKIRLRDNGTPEILPPLRVDPKQKPRLHTRFHTQHE